MSEETQANPKAISATIRLYIGLIVKGWRWTLPLVVIVSVASILVFYVPPLVIAKLIGSNPDTTTTLTNGWLYLVLFGGAWLLGEAFWRLAFWMIQRFEINAFEFLFNYSFENLLKQDLAFYHNRFAGSITKNTVGFTRRFEGFFDTIIFDVISTIIPAIFGLAVLFFISPLLSMALLGMMILGVVIVKSPLQKRLKLVKLRESKHSTVAGHIADVVGNITAVKSFGMEKHEVKTHHKHVASLLKATFDSWHYHNTHIDTIVSPIYVATNVLGLGIILSLGVDTGTKAQLFLAFSYYSTFSRFLWSFNSVYRRLEEAITEAALFVDYTLVNPEIKDSSGAHELVSKHGEIEFVDVDFTHGDGAKDPLFRNFSLKIPAGQKIGLVGHSGAGKSTLVNLLLRFSNIDRGTITIDGQAIANVTQESLHKSIAYVPQEPALFHRSLHDNIAYGKPTATREEVELAARRANALEFIEKLPEGFDTLVGERGVKLSGGQRQRIAIARAILKDAPILVLDEATSALDSESEKLIQASLSELMKDRTSIVIAHRLSTISKLDRIIVLSDGVVFESGTHAELLSKKAIYASLWAHQSGGFIEE